MHNTDRIVNHDAEPDGSSVGIKVRIGLAYLVPLVLLVFFRCHFDVHVCDDAYISLKSALNLSQGRGLTFNPGQSIYVFTNPLWVLLAALVRGITGDLVVAVRSVSFISEALLVAAIVHLSRKFTRDRSAGMLAAVLLLTNTSFLLTSFTAMEMPLYLLLWVVVTDLLTSRRWIPALALGALAVWVRFDGILLYGVALLYWGWNTQLWRVKDWRWKSVVWPVVPSLIVVAGYLAFGKLVFGEWVPMSVQRKALTRPELFSVEWQEGFLAVSREFLHSLIGQHYNWYPVASLFRFLAVPLVVGLVYLVWRRKWFLLPLAGMTGLYVASFLASGSEYARHSPWYFAPILPLACLLEAIGCRVIIIWIGSLIKKREASIRYAYVVILVFAVVWTVLAYRPLAGNAEALRSDTLGRNQRERLYATAAIWAGRVLDEDAMVAANEIGAVGFYLPPGQSVLDMFGLLSEQEDLGVDYLVRIQRDQPELIITQQAFPYRKRIHTELKSAYRWVPFRQLAVGVRADLVDELLHRVQPEMKKIYGSVNLDREYDWGND